MNDYNKFIYVVYCHVDPTNNEIVYVGMGLRERPWAMPNSGGDAARYGKRSKAHFEWYLALEQKGILLQDVVVILNRNLSKKDALLLEKEEIKRLTPRFNKPIVTWNTKVNQDVYDEAALLHKQGLPLSKISDKLDVSVMAIQRALSGKSVSIKNKWYVYNPNKHTYRLKKAA